MAMPATVRDRGNGAGTLGGGHVVGAGMLPPATVQVRIDEAGDGRRQQRAPEELREGI